MSRYGNSRVRSLAPYVPGEQPRGRRFIKLNTNENPYPPSPAVVAAIQKALAEGGRDLRLYPDPECLAFREAVAARYGLGVDNVFAGNGSDEILAFAFAAFFESGPAAPPVLFPDVTYSFYPVYAGLWGVPYTTQAVREDFSLDPGDYLAGSAPTGGVIFPNPNAPTGRALPLAAIEGIAASLENQGKVLIVDEAYIAFATGPGVASAAPLLRSHPNLLVVQTLSKSASLAGLRAGFALGSRELIDDLRRVRDSFNSYTLDRLALAGAAAAVADAAYYDDVNRRVVATRERVSAALSAGGFTVVPSEANFIFIRHPRLSGEEFFVRLREQGVLTRHFDKPRLREFLRVSMGTDGEMDVFLGEAGAGALPPPPPLGGRGPPRPTIVGA